MQNPHFLNPTLNKHLKLMEQFHKDYHIIDYYNFCDYMNYVNYIVGDSSEILFSKDREKYFLGTLMTHYLPELLTSLRLSQNILKKYKNNNSITKREKNIFTEHNKLIYLSSDEVDNIIKLLNKYRDTKNLQDTIGIIKDSLKNLKNIKKALLFSKNNHLNHSIYLNEISNTLKATEILTEENITLLKNLLKSDEEHLNRQITLYNFLQFFIIVLVTLISLYFFRVFNSNVEKDKELVELNKSLVRRVKLAVNESKKREQLLEKQTHLAQMGEMISMIAHQWRQPLNAISLTTSNLRFKIIMDNIEKNYFEKEILLIDEYTQHLSKTIDDFRGFFKEDKTKTKTSFQKIVESTLSIVRASTESKKIKIITHYNTQLPLETFENEIKQVVLNIIKNAEDALLERDIKNPTITIEINKHFLSIKDNAGGINEDILDNIFNPYFSTKKEKDSTGLGLYMSKIIIEEHCDGELRVYNDNDGAIFTIKI